MDSGQRVHSQPRLELMDVTRTIRYEGSYQEALVLRQMLEEEAVHVELPRKDREQLEWVEQQDQKRQAQERFDHQLQELHERQEQERLELWERFAHGRQGQERQAQERQDLKERQDREREELWGRLLSEGWEPAVPADVVTTIVADLNQVVLSLVSTGAAAAIASAVKKFRSRASHSKVEVVGEAQQQKDESLPPPQPHSA